MFESCAESKHRWNCGSFASLRTTFFSFERLKWLWAGEGLSHFAVTEEFSAL
jgi:hypothetical protein